MQLQKEIEKIADTNKAKLNADEIIVSIMEAKTGNILSLASSNRFNPNNIEKDKRININNNAIEFAYEPGSVLIPITVAIALDKNRVGEKELFSAYNQGQKDKNGLFPQGIITIDRWKIKDQNRFTNNTLSVEDIVVNTSYIGSLLVANRLSGKELLDGYEAFGLNKKTNIDFPNETIGQFPTLAQLSSGEQVGKINIFKSTVSYGQGASVNFIQLMQGYNIFNNDGKIVQPSITKQSFENPSYQIVSPKTTAIMKDILIKTALQKSGKFKRHEGLEIGGKTAVANIAENGKYDLKYMSSFFGFVNDEHAKYTIGITVKNPISKDKYKNYDLASDGVTSLFNEVVTVLVKDGYLKPNETHK
jgi:cell division protein FtsI (penicillin-binding protein 3)